MTAAIDMLAAVRALGGEVRLANSGRLKVIAPAPLPKELIEQLRAAKPDLLTLLSSPEPQTEPRDSWADAEEERAAIVEYDTGAPRAWAEGFARLIPTMHRLTYRRAVGCGSLTIAVGSSMVDGPDKQQHSAGDRSICLAAIGNGHSLASIMPACFGSSTAES